MRHVTSNLAIFSSETEVVIGVRDKEVWIDAVHVSWGDVPALLATLETMAIEEKKLTELVTLRSRLGRAHYDFFICRRHLEYRIQEAAKWMAFEAAVEERLRMLGVTIPVGESVTDTLLAWMDRLCQARTGDSHDT